MQMYPGTLFQTWIHLFKLCYIVNKLFIIICFVIRRFQVYYMGEKHIIPYTIRFIILLFYFPYSDISLLIGSSSNYAGDGPKVRINSLELNGFKVEKSIFRYFVKEKNNYVLTSKFPGNSINIGDEIIQLNNLYCEHIGNVFKYIETTDIQHIQIKCKTTEQQYEILSNERERHNDDTSIQPAENSTNFAKRRRITRKIYCHFKT